jgi:hypothetical protein
LRTGATLANPCFWVALSRLPLGFKTENGVDAREDYEYLDDETTPYLPYDNVVTNDECEAVGLPPNPEWERIESGESYPEPDFIREMLKTELTDEFRVELEENLSDSIALRDRQQKWNEAFNEFVDQHRHKLFLSLCEGRLGAQGKRLSDADELDWKGIHWEPIPLTFWISYKIDWAMSRAEGRGGKYGFILVDTNELIKVFPLPSLPEGSNIMKIGDQWVLPKGASVISAAGRTLGRPPLKWDEFHLEVAKYVQRGTLPEKQDSFIFTMEQWCKTHWGRKVGRSTILQKVKPYYDTFVRPKKSERSR